MSSPDPTAHWAYHVASWAFRHGEALGALAFVLCVLLVLAGAAYLWFLQGARIIVAAWIWRRGWAWWRDRRAPGGGSPSDHPGGAGGPREQSAEYHAYMQSRGWRRRRGRVLRRAGRRCQRCGARAVDVHHLWYGTPLGSEPDAALSPLCETCHAKAHGR